LKSFIFPILLFSTSLFLPAQKGRDFYVQWHSTGGGLRSNWLEVPAEKDNPFINLQLFLQFEGEAPEVFLVKENDSIKIPEDHLRPERGKWFGFTDLKNENQRVYLFIRHPEAFRLIAHKVRLYYPGKSQTLTPEEIAPKSQAGWCDCPYPPVITRDQWCPNNQCPPPSSYTHTEVKFLIVHHTATPNGESDWAARVRQIWDFHVNTRGWADIGYNYLIDQNGLLYVGRGEDAKGAHFSGYNSGTCGIAYLGTFSQFTPPDTMHATFKKYAAYKSCQKHLTPTEIAHHQASGRDLYAIAGHRDSGSGTECPGDILYAHLPALRSETQQAMCGCNTGLNLVVEKWDLNAETVQQGESIGFTASMRNLSAVNSTNDSIYFTVNGTPAIRYHKADWPACEKENFSDTYTLTEPGNNTLCVEIINHDTEISLQDNKMCRNVYVNAIAEPEEYTLYPNPADQYIALEIPDGRNLKEVRIFDMSGRLIRSVFSHFERIDTSRLSDGIYQILIKDNKEKITGIKLLIVHE